MPNPIREKIRAKETIVAPFVYDGLQARLAEQVGFESIYMTGFGTCASYGKPDLGLLTMTEMTDRARLLTQAADIPLICDADTGYGNPINVIRTVREYEAAGAAAIHIEDQVFPKRCGFLDGKEVTPPEEMVEKIRAAIDHRSQDGIVLIARTDALQPNGWDDVCRRVEAYMDAGADIAFVDGIRTPKDLDDYCRKLEDYPLLYNGMIESLDQLSDRGFRIIIHPGTMMGVFEATRDLFRQLMEKGQVELSDSRLFADIIQSLGVSETLDTATKYQT